MIETQMTVGTWRQQTFGVEPTSVIAKYAADEVSELREALEADPKCLLESTQAEAADIAVLLFGLATEAGFNLLAAVDRKMAVNRKRRWEKQADGTWLKVK